MDEHVFQQWFPMPPSKSEQQRPSDEQKAVDAVEMPMIQGKIVSEKIHQRERVRPAHGQSIPIGTRLQLLIDDHLIDVMTGADFALHHPIPADVALTFDAPWEAQISSYVTIFRDNGLYRMYYDCHGICYAESRDGIHWVKPNLSLVSFRASRRNNILWIAADRPGTNAFNLNPFRDENPHASRDELYKAIDGAPPRALGSPDGIHWHYLQHDPVMTGESYDSLNTAFWNPNSREYVAYLRDITAPGHSQVRAFVRRTSPDFLHWSEHAFIDDGGAPVEHLYTNGITPYFRAQDLLIGLAMRFAPWRKVVADHPYPGVSDAVLITSRDGIHFDRRFMDAFIRPGVDSDNWTERSNIPSVGIVPTGPGEISIYYSEHYRHPTNRLRRATLRTDGFVSVHASYWGGEMVTKPLRFSGSSLVINAETSAVGSVRVEILDASGWPVPGFALANAVPFYGDAIDHVVSWSGSGLNLRSLAGRPVRLRFLLRDADVYSFHFGS